MNIDTCMKYNTVEMVWKEYITYEKNNANKNIIYDKET